MQGRPEKKWLFVSIRVRVGFDLRRPNVVDFSCGSGPVIANILELSRKGRNLLFAFCNTIMQQVRIAS